MAIVAAALAAGTTYAASGCGNDGAPDPFDQRPDAGVALPDASATDGGGSAPADAAPDADPTLGGPCVDDGQCDDGLACTDDACDPDVGRCRFTPDDTQCQNDFYCDGLERCDEKLGCRAGEPVSCSDGNSCTIDACDEATKSCSHALRDADMDGDPDVDCPPDGHDCDDTNPNVSSTHPEVCDNGIDDDCNGKIDEAPCVTPSHDTCLDPLAITASGSYAMSTIACMLDYASPCAAASRSSPVDAVAAIEIPAGPPVDVEVTARVASGHVAVTLAGQCGDPSRILTCGSSFTAPDQSAIAKLRARSLGDPAMSLALPLYVTTDPPVDVTLDVAFLPPEPAPANETCGTATPLQLGEQAAVELIDAQKDLATKCSSNTGDLVYSFELTAPSKVDVYAASIDGDGVPVLSLRDAGCALPSDEIACASNMDGHLSRQSLPAGTYYVAVSATAPTSLSLTVEASPPVALGSDETCSGSPVMAPNKTMPVDLAVYEDDIDIGCITGAVDAAYELDLAAKSDVLLALRIAGGDHGGVELATPPCAASSDALVCGAGTSSPIRAAKRGVAPGSYRVVVESLEAEAVDVTAFVRDAVPPTLVPFADTCADVFTIPAEGGFFEGNTANAGADYNAGCDRGSVPEGGAPDQLLELVLSAPKRVVLDMAGSDYATVLDVRSGPDCPGTEMAMACAAGYAAGRSYLDLNLAAGTYYLQIDGFALQSGAWFLDVRVVDP